MNEFVSNPTSSLGPGHLLMGPGEAGQIHIEIELILVLSILSIYDICPVCLKPTFEFIQHPLSPILSPSSRTFAELTLVTHGRRQLTRF
jgi:hypothetical protein